MVRLKSMKKHWLEVNNINRLPVISIATYCD